MPEITPLIMAEHRTFESDDSPALAAPEGITVSTVKKPGRWLHQLYQDKLLKAEPVYFGDYYPRPWQEPEQTRFIDSLIKGMPVQSLCLGCDINTGRHIVIDGQQRVFSVIRFLSGGNWTLAGANDIDPRIAGQKAPAFKDKKNPLHALYRHVESYKFTVTVIKYNPADKAHMDYLFTVFYRLNTGGVRLNNQEMRCCLYRGRQPELDGD